MPDIATRGPALLCCLALCVLAACGGAGGSGQSGGSGSSSLSAALSDPPEYTTSSEQFAALQKAGLTGDYAAFAGHLKASDPAAVAAKLQQSFRGRPFDVYTRKAAPGPDSHRRLVELRSTSGRLYLYVELDKVPGGWRVAEYRLDRRQAALSAQL